MIVDEPPYDLVILFADEDARRLVMRLVERGQDKDRGCLRPLRWRAIRDPRRDAVIKAPEATLRPLIVPSRRFVIVWDHEGSGRETERAEVVEADVKRALVQAGVLEGDAEAIALTPELETVLTPAWSRVVQVVSQRRPDAQAPTQEQLLALLGTDHGFEVALASRPKEVFDVLLRSVGLRHSAELFESLGDHVSIPLFKKSPSMGRLAEALQRWFPPRAR